MSFMYCADGCYYADDPLGSQSPPQNPPPPQNNPPNTGGNGGDNGGGNNGGGNNGGGNGGGSTTLFNMTVLAGPDGSDGLIGLAVNEPGSESGHLIEASVSGDTLEVAAGPSGVLGDGDGHHRDPLLSVNASGGPEELQVFAAEEHALVTIQSGDGDLELEVVSESEAGVDLVALNEVGIPGGLSTSGDDNGSLIGQLINLADVGGVGGLGALGTGGLGGLGIGSIGGLIGIGGGSDDSGLALPGLDTGILQPILAEVDQILSLAA